MTHFLDIGAHVGNTFDRFLCKITEFDGATIWAFEPSPRHLPGLMATAERYSKRFQIKICPFGLWNGSALLRFWEKDDSQGDSFCSELNQTQNLAAGYELMIPVVSITEFIRTHIPPDDSITIKLDAEGAEYAILDDLKESHQLSQINKIMLEWHTCPQMQRYDAQQLTSIFQQLGCPLTRWMF
jgi:FkbM family methyltransferase